MVDILRQADGFKKSKGGRKNKLNLEEQLLMTLEYLREYRTYFHIGQNYGISESSAYKAVKWVEDTLVKHPNFALPGRKALMKSDMNYEVVLIDATESPIERPKKNKNYTATTLITLASEAYETFKGSEMPQKRKMINFVFQNLKRQEQKT